MGVYESASRGAFRSIDQEVVAMSPTEAFPDVSSPCNGCAAGCCQNMLIRLTSQEAARLEEQGTELREYPELNPRFRTRRSKLAFRMIGACAFLDPSTGACTAYAQRPDACREFEPGEKECVDTRQRRAGLPTLLPLPSVRQDGTPYSMPHAA